MTRSAAACAAAAVSAVWLTEALIRANSGAICTVPLPSTVNVCANELAETRGWLRSKGNSIEGGTTEVQLNIIAKRILGLPA